MGPGASGSPVEITEEDVDYIHLRLPDTGVSLFVRNRTDEDFVCVGELEYQEHRSFNDPTSGGPQMRFVWALRTPLPEPLYEELTLGLPQPCRPTVRKAAPRNGHSGAPSSFGSCEKHTATSWEKAKEPSFPSISTIR